MTEPDENATEAAIRKAMAARSEPAASLLTALAHAQTNDDVHQVYRRVWFEIQALLDQALSDDEIEGAGAGIVAGVALLVKQRDEARWARDELSAAIVRVTRPPSEEES